VAADNYREEPQSLEVLTWRVRENSANLREIFGWRREVDKMLTEHSGEIKELRDSVTDLRKGLGSVRNTLLGLAVSIAVSAVTISLSVLVATGKL